MRIVLDTKPKRCCARCGITPAQYRHEKWPCVYWGVDYGAHAWIWWQPQDSQAGAAKEEE